MHRLYKLSGINVFEIIILIIFVTRPLVPERSVVPQSPHNAPLHTLLHTQGSSSPPTRLSPSPSALNKSMDHGRRTPEDLYVLISSLLPPRGTGIAVYTKAPFFLNPSYLPM
jgi:hypothetical protein